MDARWSLTWAIAFALCQIAGILGTIWVLKTSYRREATALFKAEGRNVQLSDTSPEPSGFCVRRDTPGLLRRLPTQIRVYFVLSVLRIAWYGVAGVFTLRVMAALFAVDVVRFADARDVGVLLFTVFAVLWLIGRIGVAASGVWLFAFVIGIVAANLLFGLVWLAWFEVIPLHYCPVKS